MKSPATALLWEIWGQHRSTVAAIALLTIAGRLVDAFETSDSSPLTVLLAMTAFLLLLAVFNYTESSGGRGLGGFPRRLFALPVTSLRLVTVPMLVGIISTEILYLVWMAPLSRGGSTSPVFVAVLFGAVAVFYLWALWTLERVGALKLIVIGGVVSGVFVIGLLPSFPPEPPPFWRAEPFLAGLVTVLAVAAFLLSWRHVARLRAGDARSDQGWSLSGLLAGATPTRRTAFTSASAAQFWYEWRSSGMVLPALVAAHLVVAILPMSVSARGEADATFRLLLLALTVPVGLAVPVGIAFSKPAFWSEDLAVPGFVAVRPLSCEDLITVKLKVAALSAVLSWAVMLVFLMIWLTMWGNVDSLSQIALGMWAFHGRSVIAVYGMVVLFTLAATLVTWRLLVSRLWSGSSGNSRLFVGSVLFVPILLITAIASDAQRLPGWLLEDPARLAPLAWIAAIAVIVKYWLAAYTWRNRPARYSRGYLLLWLAGTALFLALGLVVWRIVRIYLPLDVERVRSLVILMALLAVPLARLGLAPSSLARNRHRP